MIWPWQRELVYSGFSLESVARVREVLAADGIRYVCRVINTGSAGMRGRGARGFAGGGRAEFERQYEVSVHRNDVQRARFLLRDVPLSMK